MYSTRHHDHPASEFNTPPMEGGIGAASQANGNTSTSVRESGATEPEYELACSLAELFAPAEPFSGGPVLAPLGTDTIRECYSNMPAGNMHPLTRQRIKEVAQHPTTQSAKIRASALEDAARQLKEEAAVKAIVDDGSGIVVITVLSRLIRLRDIRRRALPGVASGYFSRNEKDIAEAKEVIRSSGASESRAKRTGAVVGRLARFGLVPTPVVARHVQHLHD